MNENILFYCSLLFICFSLGCTVSPTSDSRFANRDFSNKPVNLNDPDQRRKFDELGREVERNRKLWKEKQISNYDFEIQRLAEGFAGDWHLTFRVRNNKTLPPDKKYDYPSPDDYEEINSIDKLFDYSQRMLEEGYRVSVAFNQEYGYPEKIGVYGRGYVAVQIREFRILK